MKLALTALLVRDYDEAIASYFDALKERPPGRARSQLTRRFSFDPGSKRESKPRGTSEGIAYAVYGRLDGRGWGEDISSEERVVAWVSGSALQGNERDDLILERIRVAPLDASKCTFHLDYGWDVILGRKPRILIQVRALVGHETHLLRHDAYPGHRSLPAAK